MIQKFYFEIQSRKILVYVYWKTYVQYSIVLMEQNISTSIDNNDDNTVYS